MGNCSRRKAPVNGWVGFGNCSIANRWIYGEFCKKFNAPWERDSVKQRLVLEEGVRSWWNLKRRLRMRHERHLLHVSVADAVKYDSLPASKLHSREFLIDKEIPPVRSFCQPKYEYFYTGLKPTIESSWFLTSSLGKLDQFLVHFFCQLVSQNVCLIL